MKVLIVDDSISVRKALEKILSPQQLQVHAAESAEKALSMMPEVRPELVIADVVMPGMTGFELCQALKQDASYQHIPIMLISGIVNASVENQARHVGAVGVIKKPFTPEELLPKVKQTLQKRTQATLVETKPVSPAPATPPTPAASTPVTPVPITPVPITPVPVTPRPITPTPIASTPAAKEPTQEVKPIPATPPASQPAQAAETPAPRANKPLTAPVTPEVKGVPKPVPTPTAKPAPKVVKPAPRPAITLSAEVKQSLVAAIKPILEKTDVLTVMLIDDAGQYVTSVGQELTDHQTLAGYIKFLTSASGVLGQNLGDDNLKSLVLEYAQRCVVVTRTHQVAIALILKDMTSLSIARYMLKKQLAEIDKNLMAAV